MTPAQCRAARGLSHMTINALAEAAGAAATTIWDYETEAGAVPPADVDNMRMALEHAGVEFIERGVRLRNDPASTKRIDVHRSGACSQMTPYECRAARRLIGLSREDLASAVGMPLSKVTAFETSGRGFTEADCKALQNLFEVAGIAVINGEVKLKIGG
jgi:transcriptional regulator with XRE-family HTH domain